MPTTTKLTPTPPPGLGTSSPPAASRGAMLTSATSATSHRPTSPGIRSATSLPASAGGPSPLPSPGGPIIAPSGPDHARASLSPRQAREKGLLTIDTSGRTGSGSSASAVLQSFLENKLRERPFGSTKCSLTWRAKVTRAGRQICLLLASTRGTLAKGSGLLPTLTAQSYGNNRGGAAGRTGKVRHSLESLARHGLLPTLTASRRSGLQSHGRNAFLGTLNPAWACWYMGFPPEWEDSAPTATRSSRRSPPSSSKPTSTAESLLA